MAHKAKEVEEKLAVGERVLTEEFLAGSLPHVKVKAVYLGGNKHKTVRLKGRLSILRESPVSIASLVLRMFGKDRKWVDLLEEEQEQVRNELAKYQDDAARVEQVVKQEAEHFTEYDFSTVDALGRKLPNRTEEQRAQFTMTEDGRRFQWVEHLAHIVALNRMVDQDGSKQFEIRGSDPEIRVIRQYLDSTRKIVNPDSGAQVLADMGLEDK